MQSLSLLTINIGGWDSPYQHLSSQAWGPKYGPHPQVITIYGRYKQTSPVMGMVYWRFMALAFPTKKWNHLAKLLVVAKI